MEAFRWDSSFLTGLDDVDQQHHLLVDLINRFSSLIEAGQGVPTQEMEEVFNELAQYAQFHFTCEEKLATDWGVDPRHRDGHLEAHELFIRQLLQMRSIQQPGESSSRDLLAFLTHWLAYHILGTDQVMARQIEAIKAGNSPEAAFALVNHDVDGATGPLLRSLNGLFEILSNRNQQLTELNQDLERRVGERTQDLSDMNDLLVKTIQDLQAEKEESRLLSQKLALANQHLESMAMTDVLTGLPNRRHAMDRLQTEWSTAVRFNRPLTLVMVDADGFKGINDGFGHEAGDQVLRVLGRTLKSAFRIYDFVSRLGGDEFLVICPGAALPQALAIAERVRAEVAALRVPAGTGEWQGSISVGVAARIEGISSPMELLKIADEGVYRAKAEGRNRVAVSPRAYGSLAEPGIEGAPAPS
jgi:hemerythrin